MAGVQAVYVEMYRNTPFAARALKTSISKKIDPAYSGPVLYVKDASRGVGVASKLLSDGHENYHREIAIDHDAKRKTHAGKVPKKTTIGATTTVTPNSVWHLNLYDYPLDSLLDTIDWMPSSMRGN